MLAPLGEQGQIPAREIKEVLVLLGLCGVTPQATHFRVLTDWLELQKVDLQTKGVFGSGGSGEEEDSGLGPQVGAGLGAQGTSLLESLCLPYQGTEAHLYPCHGGPGDPLFGIGCRPEHCQPT